MIPTPGWQRSWRRTKRCARRCLTWMRSGCDGTHSWNGAGARRDHREPGAGTAGLRPRGATAGLACCRRTRRGSTSASRRPPTRPGRRYKGSDPGRPLPILLARGARRTPGCLWSGLRLSLCVRISTDASVDHFVPKSRRWDLVYEWSNYRLACTTMNSYTAMVPHDERERLENLFKGTSGRGELPGLYADAGAGDRHRQARFRC